jgi:hypothetical protein
VTVASRWDAIKRAAGLGQERGGRDILTRPEVQDAIRRGILPESARRLFRSPQQGGSSNVFDYDVSGVGPRVSRLHGGVDAVDAVRLSDVADRMGIDPGGSGGSSGGSDGGSSGGGGGGSDTPRGYRASPYGPIPADWQLVTTDPGGVWDVAFRDPDAAETKVIDVDRPQRLIRNASDAPVSIGEVTLPGESEPTPVQSGESPAEARERRAGGSIDRRKIALAAGVIAALAALR